MSPGLRVQHCLLEGCVCAGLYDTITIYCLKVAKKRLGQEECRPRCASWSAGSNTANTGRCDLATIAAEHTFRSMIIEVD